MGITTNYSGVLNYLQTHWPVYLIGFAGGIGLLLITLLVSLNQGWFSFASLAFAFLLIAVYFLVASLWAVHKIYNRPAIIEGLFEIGEIKPDQNIVFVDLALKTMAIDISRQLSTGRVIVVDVYNPQLAPARWLSRATQKTEHPDEDPRIEWKVGSIDLLPLPDQSAKTAMLVLSASEFWQQGDRLEILEEIFRILAPGGILLMVERVRTLTNILVLGPVALRMPGADYWRDILAQIGFETTDETLMYDMLQLIRAERI